MCQTPPHALKPILPYLDRLVPIWEPACGEGLLVTELHMRDFNVMGTDIIYGQDFFTYDYKYIFGNRKFCIVTNPPYSVIYPWIARCYEIGMPFALLMKLETLGAAKAQKLFASGMELILMNKRINFKMPNLGWTGKGAHFPSAWFTNGLNIGKQITYYWF
jgi:hypothetical protein